MAKLAIKGGKPVHTTGWSGWPIVDESDAKKVADVVRSGIFGFGPRVAEFEAKFPNIWTRNMAFALTPALRQFKLRWYLLASYWRRLRCIWITFLHKMMRFSNRKYIIILYIGL